MRNFKKDESGSAVICRSITEVYCVDKNYKGDVIIPMGATDIVDHAFQDCGGIKSVVIPNTVTRIGEEAFMGCSGIKSIVIPDSVTDIDIGAFTGCTALTTVITGTGIEHISDLSFRDCSALTAFYGYADTYTAKFAGENGYYFEALPEKKTEETEIVATN